MNFRILGGGVVGLSTAYYLSQSIDPARIGILDSAPELCAGASGQATGILHYGDSTPETNSLSRLAWNLHKTLALENNGEVRYGFSPLVAYNITVNGGVNRTLANHRQDVKLPRWLKNSEQYTAKIEPFNTAAGKVWVHII
jgi:glycine/D-amino acid oxidase-like deaminating enzyme